MWTNEIMLSKIKPMFPKAYIHKIGELILISNNKINLYFMLHDVHCQSDFECKLISWLSRPAHKGTTLYWQDYILRGLNSYFGTTWSKEDMSIIYTKLGNDINIKLCNNFIMSGFDLNLLKD